jgi:hypothetical protein
MWLLYKSSSYSWVPKTLLVDLQLYVACYYSTTPTYYLCATRGVSVGPSVGVNIDFVWISLIFEHWFCLNYMGTVHHWQPFWSTTRLRFIDQCWYFNPQWTPVPAILPASRVITVFVSWEKCAVTSCLCLYWCLWRGLGGGGGTFWHLNASLTFKGPKALQTTTVNQIGVNKIAPNFDTLFATHISCSAI